MAALLVGFAGGCGRAEASVGVTVEGDDVTVMAKACGDAGIGRVDVVDPARPDSPLWRATLDDGPAARTIDIAPSVPGYRVEDARPDGTLPDRELRVLVEGSDGETWGGPRFTPSDLAPGTLRVAGTDVPVDEWEAEAARCPDVGIGAALIAGLATAAVAAALWLVVRLLARAFRRDPPDRRDSADPV